MCCPSELGSPAKLGQQSVCCTTSRLIVLLLTYPKIGDANFKCRLHYELLNFLNRIMLKNSSGLWIIFCSPTNILAISVSGYLSHVVTKCFYNVVNRQISGAKTSKNNFKQFD